MFFFLRKEKSVQKLLYVDICYLWGKKDREKEGERDVEHFEFMFDSTILQNETAIC